MDKTPLQILRTPRDLRTSTLANSLAIALSILITGCIPSPNQPLGNRKKSQPGNSKTLDSNLANSTPSQNADNADNPAFQPSDSIPLPAPGESGLPLLPETRNLLAESAANGNDSGPPTTMLAPDATSNNVNPIGAPLADIVQPITGEGDRDLLAEDAIPLPLPGTRPTIERSDNPIALIDPGTPDLNAPNTNPNTSSNSNSNTNPDVTPNTSPTNARIDNPPAEAAVIMNAPLIPREQLFGNPERTMARISPDGKSLAFLAAKEGVMNVYVGPTDAISTAVAATDNDTLGIESFFWAYTSRHIIYLQDDEDNEQRHVFSVNLDTGETRNLTPLENVTAKVFAVSDKFPAELLVGTNETPPHRLHDIHRVNIVTGEHDIVLENSDFGGFVIDNDFRIRFAHQYTKSGGLAYYQPGNGDDWEKYMEFSPEDSLTSRFMGLDQSGEQLFFLDSRGKNTAGIKSLNLTTGTSKMIAENPRADVSGVLVHPSDKSIQAVAFNYDRQRWQVLDNSIAEDLKYLSSIEDGEINVTSRTLDDTLWTVKIVKDDGPTQHFLYSREPRGHKLLFSDQPALANQPLVKMHALPITTDDGLELVSYLSLPVGSDPDGDAKPTVPVPLVLLVHGGPWDRDRWGYNPVHQLLANRGYAVLSVNFRGSMGFGKNFTNAGNGEWSRRMHGDLIQAVKFAVEHRIADPDYVAIMGGSFGGYATLVGMTTTPEVFTCGVDIVGPSNLVSLLENPPPYWIPFMPVLKHRVGDHESEEGRAALMRNSPLSKVASIQRPLLIAQGELDPFARMAESDEIVAEMERRDIPVTYMVYPNEGHGLQRPENRLAFYAAVEAFFAKYLGGRSEPMDDWLDRADVKIPSGYDLLQE